MNRGPGRYRCVTYLKAWTHGSRDWADPHVLNCDFCRPIAYGDGKRFIGTIHEEAARLRARRRRATHTRRAFLAAGAASVLALATGVIWMNGEETRARPSTAGPVPPSQQSAFARLDREYQRFGRPVLVTRLTTQREQQAIDTLEWIAERQHVAEYDLVVAASADGRAAVKAMAIAMMDLMSAAELQPHIALMSAHMSSETDPSVKKSLARLISFARNG